MPAALVLGVDGQDGSYLAELLLEKGYRVTGWIPATLPMNLGNIQHILNQIRLAQGVFEEGSLCDCLEEHAPDEIYNLASPSYPAASWESPAQVGQVAALGVALLLEAIRKVTPKARFYQASTSELFGDPMEEPQNERTPFRPRNPYGIAKLYAHWMTVAYREKYGLKASSGILYNHESPRRGPGFVTRKISSAAAQIKLGLCGELRLGDLDSRRDWGYAGDYVNAMWLMAQRDQPTEYVIGTGITHSVGDFCDLAFRYLDMDYHNFVIQDAEFIRTPETRQLIANPERAHLELGWQPSVSFEELVRLMVEHDLSLAKKAVDPGT